MAFRVGGVNFTVRNHVVGKNPSRLKGRRPLPGFFFDHVVSHGEIFSPTLKATWLRKFYHFRDKHEGMDSEYRTGSNFFVRLPVYLLYMVDYVVNHMVNYVVDHVVNHQNRGDFL